MSTLDKAISISSKAHKGQTDKACQPYILHPLRLMLKFDDEALRIIAVLHDVVEDSYVSLDELKAEGFSEEVIQAIGCLTKKENESYEDFILRVSKNNLATKVKIEDIKDNLDLSRLESVSEKDLTRVNKYHRSLTLLNGVIQK